jgi:hypothetical protein
MKLVIAFAVALLIASLATAAPPVSAPPAPACAGLQLATPAASAPALAFLPAPLPAAPVLCAGCSSSACNGRPVGSVCGMVVTKHCVVGPSCTIAPGTTCLCQ